MSGSSRERKCHECEGSKNNPKMINHSKQGGWDGVTWAYWKEICQNKFHLSQKRKPRSGHDPQDTERL